MRVHTTSAGLDPSELVPGEDLVLDIDEAHGVDLPDGTVAHDLLDVDAREEIDRVAVQTMAR